MNCICYLLLIWNSTTLNLNNDVTSSHLHIVFYSKFHFLNSFPLISPSNGGSQNVLAVHTSMFPTCAQKIPHDASANIRKLIILPSAIIRIRPRSPQFGGGGGGFPTSIICIHPQSICDLLSLSTNYYTLAMASTCIPLLWWPDNFYGFFKMMALEGKFYLHSLPS
jgi:hypothetical protein